MNDFTSQSNLPPVKRYVARALDELPIEAEIRAQIRERRRQGCFREVADLFQSTIHQFGDLPELYFYVGRAWSKLQEYQQACAAFTEAVRIEPGYAEAQSDLGLMYILLKEYETGDLHLRKAIALSPQDPIVWGRLALSLDEQGRINEAIDAIRQAIQLDPAQPGPHRHLDILMGKLRSTEQRLTN